MPQSSRTGLAVAAMVIVAAAVLVFTLTRSRPSPPPPVANVEFQPVVRSADAAETGSQPHILVRRMSGLDKGSHLELVALANPVSPRATTSLECDRISFNGGRGICLQTRRGFMTTYEALVFDARFQPIANLKLEGAPTRTRVSPDGRYGAATVFVTGEQHGYNSVSFSTKTIIIEMNSGKEIGDLERFSATRDGQPFAAKDFNFWGVTFAHDSNVFYATLMTNGRTYLVRGDVGARTLAVLRENVECPSLSPDNRLLGFKKRVGPGLAPWRFYVLDLATMTERPLASEARSIDDQLEWLDDGHVLYMTTRGSQSGIGDVWIAPVSGTEPARPFLFEADSPIVVR